MSLLRRTVPLAASKLWRAWALVRDAMLAALPAAASLAMEPSKALRLLPKLLKGEMTSRGFQLHCHGERAFRSLTEASRSAGLRPFLTWGSLLGLVREGGIIPHDLDIDLSLIDPDPGRLAPLTREMEARGFLKVKHRKLRSFEGQSDKTSILSFRHYFFDCTLDIYCLYPSSDGGHFYLNNSDPFLHVVHSFPSGLLERFSARSFLGAEVLVPDRAEEFLTLCYGDWRTPDKTSRPCLNTRVIYDPKGL